MAWWRTAYVGQKVVLAVAPTIAKGSAKLSDCPPVGTVLTIRGMGIMDSGETGLFVGIRDSDGAEIKCVVRMFRPVDDLREQSGMAVFRAILNGAPVREDA